MSEEPLMATLERPALKKQARLTLRLTEEYKDLIERATITGQAVS